MGWSGFISGAAMAAFAVCAGGAIVAMPCVDSGVLGSGGVAEVMLIDGACLAREVVVLEEESRGSSAAGPMALMAGALVLGGMGRRRGNRA
jgi:hypothetical protein